MNCIRPSLFVLAAASVSAHAAGPDPKTIDFPKNMEFAAQVTLLKPGGGKPTHKPFKDGDTVQLRFDEVVKSTPKTVPCTLTIPKKVGQIAAGEAAVIGIKCSEVINMPREKLGFQLVDGGAAIGSGAFRP